MAISQHLPERFVKNRPYKKLPAEKGWPTKPHSKAEAEMWIKQGYETGLLMGDGYVGIDCDTSEMKSAVEKIINTPTFTTISAKRKMPHFIYLVKGFEKNLDLKQNGKAVGEILCKGKQVIIAPTRYKITEKDMEKTPQLQHKVGDIPKYQTLNDIPIAEIDLGKLMELISKFESKIDIDFDRYKQQESRGKYDRTAIDNLSITSVISTSGLNQNSQGQYYGENLWHGSSTGQNFWISPNENLAYCFRCNTAISPAKAIALNEGIISSCSDTLKGDDFVKTLVVARKDYGLDDGWEDNTPEISTETTETPLKPLKFWTIRDYDNYKPPKNFFIENLIYPCEGGMLYGQTSHLKSMVQLHQAICIASGKKFLGFKVKKQVVAVLSAENTIKTDKKRLKLLMRGLGVRKKDIPLYILPRSECGNVLDPNFKKKLFEFVEEKQVKMLYLDTINPLTPELDDNKAKDVTTLFNQFLKPLNDLYGCHVQFLHHTDKQSKAFLGSTKWKANCDYVFRIVRKGLEPKVKIYSEKNRGGETDTLEVAFDFNEKFIKLKLIDTKPPAIYEKNRKVSKAWICRQELSKLIIEGYPRTRDELLDNFQDGDIDISPSTLDRTLRALKKDGKIKKLISGAYKLEEVFVL